MPDRINDISNENADKTNNRHLIVTDVSSGSKEVKEVNKCSNWINENYQKYCELKEINAKDFHKGHLQLITRACECKTLIGRGLHEQTFSKLYDDHIKDLEGMKREMENTLGIPKKQEIFRKRMADVEYKANKPIVAYFKEIGELQQELQDHYKKVIDNALQKEFKETIEEWQNDLGRLKLQIKKDVVKNFNKLKVELEKGLLVSNDLIAKEFGGEYQAIYGEKYPDVFGPAIMSDDKTNASENANLVVGYAQDGERTFWRPKKASFGPLDANGIARLQEAADAMKELNDRLEKARPEAREKSTPKEMLPDGNLAPNADPKAPETAKKLAYWREKACEPEQPDYKAWEELRENLPSGMTRLVRPLQPLKRLEPANLDEFQPFEKVPLISPAEYNKKYLGAPDVPLGHPLHPDELLKLKKKLAYEDFENTSRGSIILNDLNKLENRMRFVKNLFIKIEELSELYKKNTGINFNGSKRKEISQGIARLASDNYSPIGISLVDGKISGTKGPGRLMKDLKKAISSEIALISKTSG